MGIDWGEVLVVHDEVGYYAREEHGQDRREPLESKKKHKLVLCQPRDVPSLCLATTGRVGGTPGILRRASASPASMEVVPEEPAVGGEAVSEAEGDPQED